MSLLKKNKHLKGIHKSKFETGESDAGISMRHSKSYEKGHPDMAESSMSSAKNKHREVLGEIRYAVKPNLKGLANGGEILKENYGGKMKKMWFGGDTKQEDKDKSEFEQHAIAPVDKDKAKAIANAFAHGGEACPTCGHDDKESITAKIMAKRHKAVEPPMSKDDDLMNTADLMEENVDSEHTIKDDNEEDDGDFVARIMKHNKEKKAKFAKK